MSMLPLGMDKSAEEGLSCGTCEKELLKAEQEC